VIRRHPERYRAFALCAHSQIDKLFAQCLEFKPQFAVVRDARWHLRWLSVVVLQGCPPRFAMASSR
jgi:1-deoxy-D-xylulose 5-phosphate reductoisomerase